MTLSRRELFLGAVGTVIAGSAIASTNPMLAFPDMITRFTTLSGFNFVFGYDPTTKKYTPGLISWNDPNSGDWVAAVTNKAGTIQVPHKAFHTQPMAIDDQSGDNFTVYWKPFKGRIPTALFLNIGLPLVWETFVAWKEKNELCPEWQKLAFG